jgi:hypothetical protein
MEGWRKKAWVGRRTRRRRRRVERRGRRREEEGRRLLVMIAMLCVYVCGCMYGLVGGMLWLRGKLFLQSSK